MGKKVSRSFGIAMFLWAVNLFAQGPDTLWTRTYGGADYDFGNSVQETSDGGYIVAGFTRSSLGAGFVNVCLIKTDKNGDTLWTKTYGGADVDIANAVQETSDGGYIVVGWTYSFGAGESDVYLIKTDAKGDVLWTKTYGGIDKDGGWSVQQISNSEYLITGDTKSFGAVGRDVYLIKANSNGDVLWTKTYGGIDDDQGYSVQQTSDSGYIIVGRTLSFGGGESDVYLIKTDAKGDTLWTKTYGGPNEDVGWSIQETSDEGYIIAGYTSSFGAGSYDIYLIRMDTSGDTLWTKTYGGTLDDEGRSVQETSDGGYIIAGYTRSFGTGYSDVYLIKTKPDVDIKENAKCKVQNAKLDVYPNPFSQKTVIRYTINDAGYKPQDFSLIIYDISGRVVRDLTNNLASCIINHVSAVIWDGRDDSGEEVSSGVYFLRFEVGGYSTTKKLLIMR